MAAFDPKRTLAFCGSRKHQRHAALDARRRHGFGLRDHVTVDEPAAIRCSVIMKLPTAS